MSYWLIKEEPTKYSFENLVADEKTRWDGVKNNLALKHLRAMKKGDRAVFYETGKVKSAVGVVEITRGPYPDPDQEDERLVVVDVRAIKKTRSSRAARGRERQQDLRLLRTRSNSSPQCHASECP